MEGLQHGSEPACADERLTWNTHVCHLHRVCMHWIICPLILMMQLLSIRVASLADVDTVHSWIEKWQIEPGWTSVANRRNVVSSGNVIFSPTPSFSDGVKWNGDYLCPPLERMPSLHLLI